MATYKAGGFLRTRVRVESLWRDDYVAFGFAVGVHPAQLTLMIGFWSLTIFAGARTGST